MALYRVAFAHRWEEDDDGDDDDDTPPAPVSLETLRLSMLSPMAMKDGLYADRLQHPERYGDSGSRQLNWGEGSWFPGGRTEEQEAEIAALFRKG